MTPGDRLLGDRLPGVPVRLHVAEVLHVDARGRTATASDDAWVGSLVRAVLLTHPGERVHRPDFGSGLPQLVFQPVSGEVAGTVQYLVEGALQRWVGHLVEVDDVEAVVDDGRMLLHVAYTVRRTGERARTTVAVGA